MVAVLVEPHLEDPCAWAGITITDLGVGDSVVSVWRIADGEREEVQGYRRYPMNDGAFVEDWAVPLGRPVRYEVEVLSGPNGAARITSGTVTIASPVGYLQDALDPSTAVAIIADDGDGVSLRASALSDFERQADISIFKVMGSKKPMALIGERMAALGVDTSVATQSAQQNAQLAALLESSANLLFRPLPEWGDLGLSGTMYLANPSFHRLPVNVSYGGNLTWWDLKSDVVQAPAIKVLTAIFTYGDVMMLFNTYQDKLNAMAGKTYLEDLKNPLG
ncbi:hypothetical protein LJR013_003190 [Pseudarthrobacter oxydans]|uniref:hypothetical protein n=1 Tax=Pseudarthrobacter oxydans TaxID=1671 RepID=UPI003ECC6D44